MKYWMKLTAGLSCFTMFSASLLFTVPAYASPTEQGIVLQRLESATGEKSARGVDAKIKVLKRKVLDLATANPNQKHKAKIIFSKALHSQELVELVQKYELEVLKVTFVTFDPKSGKQFGSGYFNLAARFGSTADSVSHYETQLVKFLDRSIQRQRDSAIKERSTLAKNGASYFEFESYATAKQLLKLQDDPKVKVVDANETVSSEDYQRYQEMQQRVKLFQEGLSSGKIRPGMQMGGNSDSTNSLTSQKAKPETLFFSEDSNGNGGFLNASFTVQPSALGRGGAKLFDAPEIQHSFRVAQTYPYPCPSSGNPDDTKCPNNNAYQATNLYSDTYLVVYPYFSYDPYYGYVVGSSYSSFAFDNLSAYLDSSLVPCGPYITGLDATCANVNGTFVTESSYEHEIQIPNPYCAQYGYFDCFVSTLFYTDLPYESYQDTTFLDTGSIYNATAGTNGGNQLLGRSARSYVEYVEYYSNGENLLSISQTPVRVKSQIGTDFAANTFPVTTVFGIDTAKIAEFYIYLY